MRVSLPVLAFGILVSSLAVRPAVAATAGTSFSVTTVVEVSCQVSITPSRFRTFAAKSNAASAVSVTCSNSAPYNVSLIGPTTPSERYVIAGPHADALIVIVTY